MDDRDVRYEVQTRKRLFVAAELDLLREYQPLLERCAKGTTQVYLTLQAFINHQHGNPLFGYAWPSQQLVGLICNISERQIRYCMAALRTLGMVTVQRRSATNQTSLIIIEALPPLEKVVQLASRVYPGAVKEVNEASQRS